MAIAIPAAVVILVLGATLFLGPLRGALAASATRTGGLNLNAWCARHYPASGYLYGTPAQYHETRLPHPEWTGYNWWSAGRAVVGNRNAYGWQCVSYYWFYSGRFGSQGESMYYRGGIHMQGACREQYANNAVAHYRNWNDPNSWYCTY